MNTRAAILGFVLLSLLSGSIAAAAERVVVEQAQPQVQQQLVREGRAPDAGGIWARGPADRDLRVDGAAGRQRGGGLDPDLVEREKVIALVSTMEHRLEAVEYALRQAEEGAYGICERCGQSIPKGRLEAIPYVRTCVRCAG